MAQPLSPLNSKLTIARSDIGIDRSLTSCFRHSAPQRWRSGHQHGRAIGIRVGGQSIRISRIRHE